MGILDAPGLTKRKGDLQYRSRLALRPDWLTVSTAATIGTPATATAITNARTFPSIGNQTAITQAHFSYSGAGNIQRVGASFPDYQYVHAKSLGNGGTGMAFAVDFMYEGAGELELVMQAVAGYSIRVYVDGYYVGSASSSATNNHFPLNFGSAGMYRVRLVSAGHGFQSVKVGPRDSVWRPPIKGPRVIVVGDSLAAGTGNEVDGLCGSLAKQFGDALGIEDCWSSSIGGTGYVAPGSFMKIGDRLAQDVIAYSPDYILWCAGHNDTGSSKSTVKAAVEACFDAVTTALPRCVQVVASPLWAPGVQAYTTGLFNTRDAIKEAAEDRGFPYMDQLEMPLAGAALSGLVGNPGLAPTGSVFSTTVPLPVRTTIHLGTYPAGERRVVTGVTGPVSSQYEITLDGAVNGTYGTGATLTEVGPSLFTGSGYVGATNNTGNSDVLLGSDGVHFSYRGHKAVGAWMAREFVRLVYA